MLFYYYTSRSINYADLYNRGIRLDRTYKTSRYSMPLLHIIGVLPSDSTSVLHFVLVHKYPHLTLICYVHGTFIEM
jgi:hypothetical protein